MAAVAVDGDGNILTPAALWAGLAGTVDVLTVVLLPTFPPRRTASGAGRIGSKPAVSAGDPVERSAARQAHPAGTDAAPPANTTAAGSDPAAADTPG